MIWRARSKSFGVEPVENQARDRVAVVFDHQHVAVARDADIRQPHEFGAQIVRRRFVDRARMARIVIAGDDQDRMAGEIARIVDLQAPAADVEALVQHPRTFRHDAAPVILERRLGKARRVGPERRGESGVEADGAVFG